MTTGRFDIMKLLHQYPLLLTFLSLASPCLSAAPSGPWDAFNYAPSTRIVRPVFVHSTIGTVVGTLDLVNDSTGNATLSGNGSYVALDFGKEVGRYFVFFSLLCQLTNRF